MDSASGTAKHELHIGRCAVRRGESRYHAGVEVLLDEVIAAGLRIEATESHTRRREMANVVEVLLVFEREKQGQQEGVDHDCTDDNMLLLDHLSNLHATLK